MQTLRAFVVFLLFIATKSNAAVIDTTPYWVGVYEQFGERVIPTMGQTFSFPTNTVLDNFTFYLNDTLNPPVKFRAYVYEWDGTKATGLPLYVSGNMQSTNAAGYEALTVNTGGIGLSAGIDYVAFFSASSLFDTVDDRGRMQVIATQVYDGGHLVYTRNGSDLGKLTTEDWTGLIRTWDLSFAMVTVVPEPGSLVLTGIALAAMFLRRRLR